MIYTNKTVFTSPAFGLIGGSQEITLLVSGPGPVAIEFLGEDGTWRQYPEAVYTKSTAQLLRLFRGRYRVAITGGPTTVEVRL